MLLKLWVVSGVSDHDLMMNFLTFMEKGLRLIIVQFPSIDDNRSKSRQNLKLDVTKINK